MGQHSSFYASNGITYMPYIYVFLCFFSAKQVETRLTSMHTQYGKEKPARQAIKSDQAPKHLSKKKEHMIKILMFREPHTFSRETRSSLSHHKQVKKVSTNKLDYPMIQFFLNDIMSPNHAIKIVLYTS